MVNWTEQLISDVSDLDNKCYNTMPLTIIIRTDLDDNGDRFFDATVFTGFNEAEGNHITDVVGADSLSELFRELARDW